MQRRYNLAHFILASVVAWVLTSLMVVADAQARIAFVSDRAGIPKIYVMDNDGGNQRRLTNDLVNEWYPSWSPDGKRIAFVSERDMNRQIFVMDNDGGNQRRLTNNLVDDWYPSWSPDGKRIAFVSDRAGNRQIFVMDADGGNLRKLTKNRQNDWHPSWSPDGKRIVLYFYWDLVPCSWALANLRDGCRWKESAKPL